jgi:hypothetical protein
MGTDSPLTSPDIVKFVTIDIEMQIRTLRAVRKLAYCLKSKQLTTLITESYLSSGNWWNDRRHQTDDDRTYSPFQ